MQHKLSTLAGKLKVASEEDFCQPGDSKEVAAAVAAALLLLMVPHQRPH